MGGLIFAGCGILSWGVLPRVAEWENVRELLSMAGEGTWVLLRAFVNAGLAVGCVTLQWARSIDGQGSLVSFPDQAAPQAARELLAFFDVLLTQRPEVLGGAALIALGSTLHCA